MKMFEIVPNFSTSDRSVINGIIDEIKKYGGNILDVDADKNHNRTVITFVCSENIIYLLYNMVKKASELIDMDLHRGLHPRIGATDVLPVIPLLDSTMDDAVKISKIIGERIGNDLNIPVYLYGESANSRYRKEISYIRNTKFQYEDLKMHINDKKYKPDYGPSEVGKAGALLVGARDFLIAYNVYLNTDSKDIGNEIAKSIRYKNGGLRYVRSLPLFIENDNMIQISMNILDYKKNPVYRVYEFIATEARKYNLSIVKSEIIGLLPEDAVTSTLNYYIKSNLNSKKVLEYNILTNNGYK